VHTVTSTATTENYVTKHGKEESMGKMSPPQEDPVRKRRWVHKDRRAPPVILNYSVSKNEK
jgi:hypothetical protein